MASKKEKGSSVPDAAETSLGLAGGGSRQDNAYRVLARKYRPQNFEDAFIGQSAMVRTLSNAFAAGRIAHAFMLTGVRGVGKTTTARIIAKALNCTGPDGTVKAPTVSPCGQCEMCRAIAESRAVDVLEMDAASRTGIDDIREIVEGVRYAPAQARYKIYIIDEVHMLSKAAFNGLLKTLEEPPPHVKFVFATTEIRKVPITVLSRCQRFDLKRVPAEELSAHLANVCRLEAQAAEEDALRLIARAAEGSVRDGLSLLDQAFAHAGGGTIAAEPVRIMLGLADRSRGLLLFEMVMQGRAGEALTEFRSQYDSGADPLAIVQDLAHICHEITRAKVCSGQLPEGVSSDEAKRTSDLAQKLSVPQLTRGWQILLKALAEVQAAPDAAAATEMALIRIAYAAELPPTDQLLRTLAPSAPLPPSSRSAASQAVSPPVARMSASAQAETRVSVAMAPQIVNGIEVQSFLKVVELAREHKEARLTYALENWVHLVSFERGRLEIRLDDAAQASLPGELSDKLSKWTGERWLVSVSNAEGEPTIVGRQQAEEVARRASAARDPLLQAALAQFPGARIVAVRDRDQFESANDTQAEDEL